MSKPVLVYIMPGQFDAVTSWGMIQMRDTIKSWGTPFSTRLNWWHDWQTLRTAVQNEAHIDACRVFLNFSLGSNAGSWCIGGLDYQQNIILPISTVIDCWLALDPSWLSIISPVSSQHVKKIIHFYNPPNQDPEGHGELKFAPDFDLSTYERVTLPFLTEHVLIDKLPSVQNRCLSTIRNYGEGQ